MPNWCRNKLIISGKTSDMKAMFGLKEEEDLNVYLHENDVTLRTWFPMPQTFIDFDTTNTKKTRDARDYKVRPQTAPDGGRIFPPLFASDEEYEEYSKKYDEAVAYQKETYGVVGWYDYNCETLGTKWDAQLNEDYFDVCKLKGENMKVAFMFDTAWDAPIPWMEAMVEKFPSLNFSIECHEEADFFNVLWTYNAKTGKVTETDLGSQYDDEEEEGESEEPEEA